jgi:hypothetical protein
MSGSAGARHSLKIAIAPMKLKSGADPEYPFSTENGGSAPA